MNWILNQYKGLIQTVFSVVITVLLGITTYFIVDFHKDFKNMLDNVNMIIVQQSVSDIQFQNLAKAVEQNQEEIKVHRQKFAANEKQIQLFYQTYELKKK
tara:strand:+ start:20770 stop:21069 length:300 start_codon:yes stop_codon:yes gene_type:complete